MGQHWSIIIIKLIFSSALWSIFTDIISFNSQKNPMSPVLFFLAMMVRKVISAKSLFCWLYQICCCFPHINFSWIVLEPCVHMNTILSSHHHSLVRLLLYAAKTGTRAVPVKGARSTAKGPRACLWLLLRKRKDLVHPTVWHTGQTVLRAPRIGSLVCTLYYAHFAFKVLEKF